MTENDQEPFYTKEELIGIAIDDAYYESLERLYDEDSYEQD